MQICVTGANGFIGQYLMKALSGRGYSIRVLTRRNKDIFSSEIEVVMGDLARPDCPLDVFLRDCDILFHCAGELHDVQAMRPLHVDGTKRLVQAVLNESSGRKDKLHWVQLSSVGAYGPPVGSPHIARVVTERTLNCPANEYEVTKTLSDELVIEASRRNSFTYTVLRPSNVFGSKMTNQSLRRLIELIRRKIFFYVGKPGAFTTYVHVEDVVAALMICAIHPRAKGEIYNLSSDCLLEELVQYIAIQLEVKTPRLRIPEPLIGIPLRLLSKVLGRWIAVPTVNVLVLRTQYPSEKIERDLGFSFSRPLPEGTRDLITEFVGSELK